MTTLFEYTSLLLIILIFLAIKSWLELPTFPIIWQKKKLFCNILPYDELGDTLETPRRHLGDVPNLSPYRHNVTFRLSPSKSLIRYFM